MRRFHVHLGVPDLDASIRFYSNLFGMPPSVEKPDYAKWMLEDPGVNFAISHRPARPGLNHLGLQAGSDDELAAIRMQFAAADPERVFDQPNVTCCHARGNRHWTTDPQGISWEAFHTLDSIPLAEDASAEAVGQRACGATATRFCGSRSETVQSAAKPTACGG